RLAADLDSLEQALQNLKTLRQRQEQTYSLVPYHGKFGENRRPIYLECGANEVVFHPGRVAIDGLLLSGVQIRTELCPRLEKQRATLTAKEAADTSPYLLILLRPSGIENYYRIQSAMEGLKIDFGYELIDEDWVLNFPEEGAAPTPQPWMTDRVPKTVSVPTPPRNGPVAVNPGPGGRGGVRGPGNGATGSAS